ncbi:MAG: serine/threonine protein kinase [Muribaculaceae bacterium]|nr:serine/threonine protein kinase [Muribaculaceae bacterium]
MRIKRIQGENDKGHYFYEFDLDSKPIGQGGMGIVYRGERIDERSGIRTEVAIKVLHDELPEEVYARAEREASIQIKHVNLVEMYGLITEYEQGLFGRQLKHHYLISELLHGLELSDLLNGKFDNTDGTENSYAKKLFNDYMHNRDETSVNIIRNIVSGVLALHDRGYIHRDIDPSNIMVTNDGSIKLIDFGIAKNLNTLSTTDRLTTTTGQFIGKAEYASPELVLGDVKNQNYTTDIYALGILLYRLLVGQLPFTGSQYDILQAQQNTKVPVKNIDSPALANVVKKATAKSQKDRYGSTAEFRVAIDEAIKNPGKRISKSILGLVAAIVIATVGIGAYYMLVKDITEPTPDIAEITIEDRFDRALALLNSNDRDSVAEGFGLMKSLAAENYDAAKIEIGLTYNPYPVSEQNDARSIEIIKRRQNLGLQDKNTAEADSVIKYLNEPVSLPPEALYVLGMTQYELTVDKNKALPHFQQAKYLLERNIEVGHGYNTNELSKKLSRNIEALMQAD